MSEPNPSNMSDDELYVHLYGNVALENVRLTIKHRSFGTNTFPFANVTLKAKTAGQANKIFTVGLSQADVSKYFKGQYDKDPFRSIAIVFPEKYLGATQTIKFLKEAFTKQIRLLCAHDSSALGLNYDSFDTAGNAIDKVVNGFFRDNMNNTPGLEGFYASVSLQNVRDKDTKEDAGYGALKVSTRAGREVPLSKLSEYRTVGVPTKVAFEVKIHQGKANIRAKLYSLVVKELIKDDFDAGTKAAALLMGGDTDDDALSDILGAPDDKGNLLSLDNNKVDLAGAPSASGGVMVAAKLPSPAASVMASQEDVSGLRDPDDSSQ